MTSMISMFADAGAGDASHGIVVGIGDTATEMGDYNLESLISHGTGTGQLSYGATTLATPTVVDKVTSMTISRSFTNNTGATITIKEVGLIVKYGSTGYIKYALISRDVLATPLNIPAGTSKSIELIMRVTA